MQSASKLFVFALVAVSCGLAICDEAEQQELGRAADPNSGHDAFCLSARSYMADQVRAKNKVPNFLGELMTSAKSSSANVISKFQEIAANPDATLAALDAKAAESQNSVADFVSTANLKPSDLIEKAKQTAAEAGKKAWDIYSHRREHLESADSAVAGSQEAVANKLRSNPFAPGAMLKGLAANVAKMGAAAKAIMEKAPQKIKNTLASSCVQMMNHEAELKAQFEQLGLSGSFEDLDCATTKAVSNAAEACRNLAKQQEEMQKLNLA